ncbi:unnamed protein product [Prorocentrum cordatum]|uniref:CHAT domain-containing protein n=1 Tax=Prorocentrum cordatum TaxID=2364126 RepID=A0ABN9PF73_9DINO|nr:unnamed protein product [Polarella glacialis]
MVLSVTAQCADALADCRSKMFQGNLQEAKDVWLATVQLARDLRDTAAQVQALRGLGVLYVNLNCIHDALACYDEAKILAEELGDIVEHCTILHNQGFALTKLGRLELASVSFSDAIAVAASLKDRPGLTEREARQCAAVRLQSMARCGAVECALGNSKQGFVHLEMAYTEVESCIDVDWLRSARLVTLTQVGRCLCGLPLVDVSADFAYEPIDLRKGLGILLEVDESLQQARCSGGQVMYTKSQHEDVLRMIGLVYERLDELGHAISFLKQADASSWKRLMHLLEDSTSLSFRDDPLAVSIGVSLQKCLLRSGEAEEALSIAESRRARSLLALMGFGRTGGCTTAFSFDEMRGEAIAHAAAIVYFSVLGDQEICTWVISSQGSFVGVVRTNVAKELGEDDLTLASMAATVRGESGVCGRGEFPIDERPSSTWHEVHQSGVGDSEAYRGWQLSYLRRKRNQERLRSCYRALFQPVENLLQGEQHLILVLDQHLWMVPFPALQDSNGTFLIEKFSIRVAPSLQVLKCLATRRILAKRPGESEGTETALVVGVSSFNGHPHLKLETLGAVPDECLAVGDACASAGIQVQMLRNRDATVNRVMSLLPQATRLVHVCTHGLLDQVALVFHGDPESEILEASQLYDRTVSARLVVLSACNTSRGQIGSDGVVGLTRPFLVAGSDLVLGTLWRVPDESTCAFMKQFYHNLLSLQ